MTLKIVVLSLRQASFDRLKARSMGSLSNVEGRTNLQDFFVEKISILFSITTVRSTKIPLTFKREPGSAAYSLRLSARY